MTIEQMLDGYRAGLRSASDELPECHKSKPAAFRHGWLNGRDDRLHKPRERADVLRLRAALIEANA